MTDPYQSPPPDPYQPYQPPTPDPYQPYQPPAPAPDPYAAPAYYPPPAYPYGYQPPRETEGLAIASLVVSCAAVFGLCFYGVGALLGIVGAILGHVARNRIARNGSNGAGMALAGIIVGWCVSGLVLLVLIGVIIYAAAGGNFS